MNTIDYCTASLAKRQSSFFDALRCLACSAVKKPVPRATKPKRFSPSVSVKNRGETAYQRALYSFDHFRINPQGREESLAWVDMELPVTFGNRGRRRCVDLIGCAETVKAALCELKYRNPRAESRPSVLASYAVLEALIYYGIVERDHIHLDEHRVWREEQKLRSIWNWKMVADSRTCFVIANENFWQEARRNEPVGRIGDLVNDIHETLGVRMLLLATPDYDFFNPDAVQNGRYVPEITHPREPDLWKDPIR